MPSFSKPGENGTGTVTQGFLESSNVKAVDFLQDDDLVERIESSDWATRRPTMTFTIPAHSKGQIVVSIPRIDGA